MVSKVQCLFLRIKLARQEQTHMMKKERLEATKVRLQFESLWGIVMMLLARDVDSVLGDQWICFWTAEISI